jgi:hypothetical protein
MLHRRVHGYRSRIPIEYNKTGEGVEGSGTYKEVGAISVLRRELRRG